MAKSPKFTAEIDYITGKIRVLFGQTDVAVLDPVRPLPPLDFFAAGVERFTVEVEHAKIVEETVATYLRRLFHIVDVPED